MFSLVRIYFFDLQSDLNPCSILVTLLGNHPSDTGYENWLYSGRSPSDDQVKQLYRLTCGRSLSLSLYKHRADQNFHREGLTCTTRHAQLAAHQNKERDARISTFNFRDFAAFLHHLWWVFGFRTVALAIIVGVTAYENNCELQPDPSLIQNVRATPENKAVWTFSVAKLRGSLAEKSVRTEDVEEWKT